MTSIRSRLLLSLLAALALAAGLIGAVIYRSALAEAESLFDYQLRQMALSLRDQGEIAPGEAAALNDEGLDFVIQIWSVDGRSVYATRAHRSLPLQTVLGLAEATVAGERWRTFGVAARGRVIQVAQPVRIRERFAADAALHSVLPLAAAAPLLAALMGWLIARSLRPLSRVAADVRERGVGSLQPLPATGLPDEVAPLVQSLNALLARLAEAMAGQRAFVADAAHELRSPLTALKLQAQLVKRASNEASRNQATEALVAGVDRAAHLVEQLLALARHEPGARAEPFAPVALAELLRQVLADLAPQAQSRDMRLSLDADFAGQETGQIAPLNMLADRAALTVLADRAALTVLADRAALTVLVRNLVDNALRYTPAGGEVRVQLLSGAVGAGVGSGSVILRVDDSGPGIAPAERERVFDRFVRGAGAGEIAGSGLGLAIVRSIAQRHGASVSLSDSPLGGLRVEVAWAGLATDRLAASA